MQLVPKKSGGTSRTASSTMGATWPLRGPTTQHRTRWSKSILQLQSGFVYNAAMTYDFKPFEKRIAEITDRLGKELSGVRTGRATPAILMVSR